MSETRSQTDLSLLAFAEWLRSQPADTVYCPDNHLAWRSQTCPIGRYTGCYATCDGIYKDLAVRLMPTPEWAQRYMEIFDGTRFPYDATQGYALAALEQLEREAVAS